MNAVLKGYLRLTRPANLPTAAADIFAGIAIAGVFTQVKFDIVSYLPIFYLVFSSVFLYAGGVVLNDVFDYKIDKIERPERPIPSGLIPLKSAAVFGVLLLVLGVVFAFLVHQYTGSIAFVLAISILLYDGFFKKYSFLGPLNMGFCRSLNLLMGMAVLGAITHWWYAIIPLVYIFAITLISRGEVHGDNKKHIIWAGVLYAIVIFCVITFMIVEEEDIVQMFPFLVLFAFMVYKPLLNAYRNNSPNTIKKAVIAGVLSLIVLDATIAVGFSVWWYGLLILVLFPLSLLLSKIFAVT